MPPVRDFAESSFAELERAEKALLRSAAAEALFYWLVLGAAAAWNIGFSAWSFFAGERLLADFCAGLFFVALAGMSFYAERRAALMSMIHSRGQ